MLGETLIRFLVGGAVVSAFALLGDVFRPKSFAGLFDAAPSVAIATLALAVAKDGGMYAAVEARSMLLAALALCAYSQLTAWLLMRANLSSILASVVALPLWFAVAFGLWRALLV